MKNMDPLNDNVATLLHQSSDKFVSELWKDGTEPNFLPISYLVSLSSWHSCIVFLEHNSGQHEPKRVFVCYFYFEWYVSHVPEIKRIENGQTIGQHPRITAIHYHFPCPNMGFHEGKSDLASKGPFLLAPAIRCLLHFWLFVALTLTVTISFLGFFFDVSVAEMQNVQRAYFYQHFPILHLEPGDWETRVLCRVMWFLLEPCKNCFHYFLRSLYCSCLSVSVPLLFASRSSWTWKNGSFKQGVITQVQQQETHGWFWFKSLWESPS